MLFQSDRRLLETTAVFVLACGLALPAAAQNWPPEPENLQFFPEDIEPRELIQEMRVFAFSLGVRCQHCHLGEEGQPIFTFDFASDEKETKQKARAMLAMVEAINEEYLAKLPESGAGRLRVECVTCHRGVPRPEQLEDILVSAAAEGADAAVAEYRRLREQHYGGGSYNFSENTLLRAAEALAGSGQLDAGVALVEESLTYTSNSARALNTLASLELERGNTAAAIAALEKALEFDPENAHVQRRLEELQNPAPAPESGEAVGEGDS